MRVREISEVIEKPELQILLNVLGEMRVSYPLYGLPLLRAKPTETGYRVELTVSRREFNERVSERLSSELPTWTDFYECFISAGIVRYANIDEFLQNLELYERLKKGVAFAPDTNLFYHRFISGFRPLDGYQIVVAEGVKKEIENAMNYKYRHRELEEIKREVRNASLLREFSNRRTKRSRKAAYIALKEFERLKDRIIIAESVKEPAHNNDEIIVKSLKHYDNMTPTLLVFLTADIAITDVAEMEGLEYFLFRYPRQEIGRHEVSAYQLRTLLFNLAAVFGVIEVNGITVFGEFGGKQGLNELKLVFPAENRAYHEFEFHLKLSRKLMEIMND
ncbi:PIN domain-containing protein [Thermococcus sp. ES12]|uniref:PIN domain-containing protein n=1 Tax=Thermococcus sp. ES12 TaxID=1638246 RepID=UPI0014306F8F|nr:PIN domain-containing protein [Thermococcus sp. ES12]